MREKYWFRASKKGIGWVPVTWQGWWIGVLYLATLVYSFFQASLHSRSGSDIFWGFVPQFLFFSAILIIVTYLKGEPLKRKG